MHDDQTCQLAMHSRVSAQWPYVITQCVELAQYSIQSGALATFLAQPMHRYGTVL